MASTLGEYRILFSDPAHACSLRWFLSGVVVTNRCGDIAGPIPVARDRDGR